MDVASRHLPSTFGFILALFLVFQVIIYFSRFEIRFVQRADKDGVLVEYQYEEDDGDADGDSANDADLDYAALDNLAQEQAQYNYRYRYRNKNNQQKKHAKDGTHGDDGGGGGGGTGGGSNGDNKSGGKPHQPESDRICTMKERVAHMRKYCDRDKVVDDTFEHKDLLVDDTNRIVYCSMPRVASTSWRTVFAKITGRLPANITWPPVHNKGFMQGLGLKFLSQFDKPDANRIAKEYFKVLIVRHPLDRLVSAWRDRLVVRNAPSRWQLGTAILAEYRDEKHYELDKQWNSTARFYEFAQYLAEKDASDDQWETFDTLCDVCMYRWDAILRVETMDTDADIVLSRLTGYRDGLPFLHSHTGDRSQVQQSQRRLKEMDRISKKALVGLQARYETDFEIFGYNWNTVSNITTCAIPTTQGDYCC